MYGMSIQEWWSSKQTNQKLGAYSFSIEYICKWYDRFPHFKTTDSELIKWSWKLKRINFYILLFMFVFTMLLEFK